MNYKSSFKITNSSEKKKLLILEPWAELYEIFPKKTFEFVGVADVNGDFEVEFYDDEIYVFAWSGSTVRIMCDGKELGISERPKVPSIPEGQSITSFVKSIFRKR